jgi:hypothetical protein
MMHSKLTAEKTANIGYEAGAKMVKDYHDMHPETAVAHYVSRETLEALLAQPSCNGVIMFPGMEAGQQNIVLVGATQAGEPILDYTTVGTQGQLEKHNGIVADRSSDGWFGNQ